jgi:hypothetical protein
MAKSTSDSTTKRTTKGTNVETKARRAPARRRADTQPAEAPLAVASDRSRPEQASAADLNPEEVQRRAYELYVGRGCTNGCDVDDWLEAERQLRSRTH